MISSSGNRVHDPNTGNGGGRMPLGSFTLKDILSLSKTSLTDMDTPAVGMQSSHPGELLRRFRLVELDRDLSQALIVPHAALL